MVNLINRLPPGKLNTFSPKNPALRLGWDASSMKDLQFCPRYYQLTHNLGYGGTKVDLEFGIFAANTFERFQKARVAGASRDDAMVVALRYAFEATWDDETQTPWGGEYADQWHCLGETKYKNNKGNAAKCPYSHKGAFFPAPTPDICVECGSNVESVRQYIPNDPNKNRNTLLRMVTWYMLEQPEDLKDGLHPYVFPDGTAALELSYAIPLPWQSPYGEPYILAGHFDQLGVFGEENWIVDQKSTKKTLNDQFFNGYSPSTQFDTYDLVGSVLFPDLNIQGVLIDAAQTLVSGAKFGRHPYRKSEALRQEQLDNIEYWIKQAEYLAMTYGETRDWPQNKENCWKCPFRGICTLDPIERRGYLDSKFARRPRWDPLKTR